METLRQTQQTDETGQSAEAPTEGIRQTERLGGAVLSMSDYRSRPLVRPPDKTVWNDEKLKQEFFRGLEGI